MTSIERRCAECKEPWPLIEFRVGASSSYSQHCEICRNIIHDRIIEWQQDMFILSCFLYANHYECVLTDEDHDKHCQSLLCLWDELTPEFKERCGANLAASTALDLEFSEEEQRRAFEWFRRVRGRDSECYANL